MSPINSGYTVMQFVGHEDDDTLFMNPDLQNFLGAGYGTVTVVTTAGEAVAEEVNPPPGCAPLVAENRFVFAHHREDGMRAAYAQMAGLPNVWNRGAYNVNGRLIEIDALQGAAQIQLVFLNLPDGGDPSIGGHDGCDGSFVACLFDNSGDPSFPTIPPVLVASPGTTFPAASDLGIPSYEYNREFLLADLVTLLNAYQPSVIRMLDPQPYQRYIRNPAYDPDHPDPNEPEVFFLVGNDNNDHVYTARFVSEALQQYAGPAGSGKLQTLFYQAYSIADQPANLGAGERQRKSDSFHAYVGTAATPYDKNALYYTCAQTQAGDLSGYLGWPLRTFERYPASASWMTSLPDGRLAAFSVMDRQLAWWLEVTPGGAWIGPTFLGGGPLAPAVSSATKANGDLIVVALQHPDDQGHTYPAGGTTPLNIVYNIRSAGTGAWSGWASLGNPDFGTGASACSAPVGGGLEDAYGRWLGTPAIAVDGADNVVVAARTTCGHVSVRALIGGVPQSTWTSLSVPVATAYDVIDGVAAICAEDGRVHVFASTMQRWMAHWVQAASGSATYDADTAGFPVGSSLSVAGPPTVTKNQDGRLQVFWRGETTGDVMTSYQLTGGGWAQADLGNTGTGGTGAIAAMRRTSGNILLFARNGFDGISANWQPSINSSFNATWSDLQNQVPTFPSAATDASGHAVVGVVGLEGELQIRRETGSVGSFGPWTAVGGGVNLAIGATVTASSSYEDSGWSTTHVADGSENSVPGGAAGFASQLGIAADHTEWVALQMPSSKTFSKIVLFPRNDPGNVGKGFPIDFTLQVWNGVTWLDRVTQTAYPQPGNAAQVFTWGSSDTTDRIRIFATKLGTDGINGHLLELAEIEILP